MGSKERCAYCYEYLGDTTDHVLPHSLCKCAGRNGLLFPEWNKVPCCRWCNARKSNDIILPTVANRYGVFKNFSKQQFNHYAQFIVENWGRLEVHLMKYACTHRDCGGVYWQCEPQELLDHLAREMSEVFYLDNKGYYD